MNDGNDNNAAKEEQPDPAEITPETVSWADLTGREKLERASWAFRIMKANYLPRHDGKPWR